MYMIKFIGHHKPIPEFKSGFGIKGEAVATQHSITTANVAGPALSMVLMCALEAEKCPRWHNALNFTSCIEHAHLGQ